MERHGHGGVRIAAALAVGILLVGCSGENSESGESPTSEAVSDAALDSVPADGTKSADGLVTKDSDTGALPGDPYRIVDLSLRNYAIDVYMDNCMGALGYEYPVVVYDWNDPQNSAWSPGIADTLTVEKAQKYGYHDEPSEWNQQLREKSATINQQSTEWLAAQDQCMDHFSDDAPFKDEEEAATDTPLYQEGIDEDPRVLAAAAEWKECMAPLGISDLPDTPGLAPSLAAEFGLDQVDAVNGQDAVNVSAREIEVATTDAQCRDSSGYTQTYYDLNWVGQEEMLAKNHGEYQARLELIENQNQAYKDYIEQHRDQ